MDAHASTDAGIGRRLQYAAALTAGFMLVEAVGGWLAGSLALIADAGHMFMDSAALLLALAAWHLSHRPSDPRRSYGYRRVQVLAALVNSLALLALVAWILSEALERLSAPRDVQGGLMLGLSLAGAAVNVLAARLLHHDHRHDLNVGAAYLHVLGDLAGSAAATVAAVLILAFGWNAADPLLSLVVAALIARGAWQLLARSAHILLEGVPEGFDAGGLEHELLRDVDGLLDVHHVHAWSLGSGESVVTLHARVRDDSDRTRVLESVKQLLAERHGIRHSTVQVEAGPCVDSPCGGDRLHGDGSSARG